jgi:hypothetical protein
MKYIALLFPLFLFSCKNDTHSHSGAAQETSAQEALPEGFADFYQQFHSDSLYQVEHIVFPIMRTALRLPARTSAGRPKNGRCSGNSILK